MRVYRTTGPLVIYTNGYYLKLALNSVVVPMVVVVLGFYVPPTAKVIRRRDLGFKSHPKDWRSPGSNPGLHGEWLNHYATEASVPMVDSKR